MKTDDEYSNKDEKHDGLNSFEIVDYVFYKGTKKNKKN